MKTKYTIILAVVLLLLGGFYYIYDVQMGGKKEKEKSDKEKLFTFDKKAITAIDITKGKEKINFVKESGAWRMTAPDKKLAAASATDGILNVMNGMKREATIDEKPGDLAQFELKPPAFEIILSSGEKKYTLLLGSKTPSGSAYYAKLPDSDTVFTVSSSISYELQKKNDDLVEKEALPLDPAKVTSLDVDYGDSKLSLSNPQNFWTLFRKDGKWSITAPKAMKGDAGKVSSFLWDIKNVKADRFITEAELAKFPPLDKERTLTINVTQTDKPAETLIIGKAGTDGKLYPAKREPSGEIFLIKDTDLKKLYKKAEDIQETRIAVIEPKDVQKLEITAGDFKAEAERDKSEGWKLTTPAKIKKNIVSLDSMLWKVQNSRFTGTVDEAKGKEALKNPEAVITLKGKDKNTIFTLTVGKNPDDAKKTIIRCEPGSGEYYVSDDEMLNQAKAIRDEIKAAQGGPAPQPSPLKSGAAAPSGTPQTSASQPASPSPAQSAAGESAPNPVPSIKTFEAGTPEVPKGK